MIPNNTVIYSLAPIDVKLNQSINFLSSVGDGRSHEVVGGVDAGCSWERGQQFQFQFGADEPYGRNLGL